MNLSPASILPGSPNLAIPACFATPGDDAWTRRPVGRYFATQDGPSDAIGIWAFCTTGLPIRPPWHWFGFRNAEGTSGAILIIHNASPRDAELIVIAESFRWTRQTIIATAKWLYNDLGLQRVTLKIRSDDRNTLDLAERLGFTREGRLRRALADDVDLVLFGMLLGSEFSVYKYLRDKA